MSSIPFSPSKPILAEDVLPKKEPKEDAGLKIHHDHTEAICVNEYDTGLQEAFAYREKKKSRKKTSGGLIQVAALVAVLGGAAYWYTSSAVNQEKVAGAWEETKTLVEETKKQTDVSEMIRTYDESLDKIEAHQAKTNEVLDAERDASAAMSAAHDDDYQKLLQEVSGTERTSQDRDREVQEKFGGIANKIREKTGTERQSKSL
jgi:uncharacterized protein HemX